MAKDEIMKDGGTTDADWSTSNPGLSNIFTEMTHRKGSPAKRNKTRNLAANLGRLGDLVSTFESAEARPFPEPE
jgi:hypothetical protein